jgi:hypothetical protein
MDTPEGPRPTAQDGPGQAATMLQAAADAQKCWVCGCLRHALDTIEQGGPSTGRSDALQVALAAAREHLLPQRYECLAERVNDFEAAFWLV